MRRLVPLIVVTAGGCAAITGQHVVIENRFKQQQPWGRDEGSVVIDVFTSDVVDPPTTVPLTALSDHGQAAIIDQTGGKPPVGIKAPDETKAGAVSLEGSIKRRIVVAVRTAAFLSPGDRVDAIHVDLSVDGSDRTTPWRITSWTQASNGQTVIDLGKSTDTSTNKLTASTGLKISPVLPGATIGGEADHTRASEVEIKDTTDFDAAVDNRGHAWLDETAGWRVSLAHNLSMDAVLSASIPSLVPSPLVSAGPLTRVDPKHKGATLPATPDDVRLSEMTVYSAFADEERPICGRAELTYRIRRIINAKAATTFSESDDRVQFVTGTARTEFLFAPPSYRPTYVLRSNDIVVAYQMPHAQPVILAFQSLDAAAAFAHWFVHAAPKGGTIGGNTVIGKITDAGIVPLTSREIERMTAAPQNFKLLKAALDGAVSCISSAQTEVPAAGARSPAGSP
ncbi:hypothetical protein [Polymorphobacter megasporae]|uniref:hypothetical protein n=1 Tax=Glacieibacterium megasporae TaxID=2835787 RepID=UPI001C1DECAE|nr:hypothetical protein [Polymorphobacter megasporae]UAJ10627.1 hypothetical protein KTC28_02400 [Polymorphobacter megasporae]